MTPPSSGLAPAAEAFGGGLAWAVSEATGLLLHSIKRERSSRLIYCTRRLALEQVKSVDIETDLDLGRDAVREGLAQRPAQRRYG